MKKKRKKKIKRKRKKGMKYDKKERNTTKRWNISEKEMN
jgi:hypothetical protein